VQNARAEIGATLSNRHFSSVRKARRVRFARKAWPEHKARAAVRFAKKTAVQQRVENFGPEWFANESAARWSKRRFGSIL
jgi:hypothetical protein